MFAYISLQINIFMLHWNNSIVKNCSSKLNLLYYFLTMCVFIFRGKGKEGEREQEPHQCVVTSHAPPTGNPGMCPDWDLNQWPFGWQVGTQSTEPQQQGKIYNFNAKRKFKWQSSVRTRKRFSLFSLTYDIILNTFLKLF